MARIVFTANIQRHVASPEAEAAGRTVREVLENVFEENPQARAMSSMTRRRCAST
jgi:sulfur-carrier protein